MTSTANDSVPAADDVIASPLVSAVACVIANDVPGWQWAFSRLTGQSVPLAQKMLFQLVWLSFDGQLPSPREVRQFVTDVDEYFIDRTVLFPRQFAAAVLSDTLHHSEGGVLVDDPPLDVVVSSLLVMIAYLVLSMGLSSTDVAALERRTLTRLRDQYPTLTPWLR